MKKSLLIGSALLVAGTMYAGPELYMGDVQMEAGKTYTYNEIEHFGNFVIEPSLSVRTDVDADFTFSFKVTSGEIVQFCGSDGNGGIGMMCTNTNEASIKGHLAAGKSWNALIDYMYGDYDSPESDIVNVPKDITLALNLDDKSYTLVMNSSEGSVSLVEKDRNVAFSNNALVYSLSGAAEAVVYDMQGRKVMSTTVSGSGSLNLGTLNHGVYIFRIGNTAGKVIVK